jgi:uncharacterized protein (DUF1810 family)
MPNHDPYNLQRFLDAQHGVYGQAERELRAGRKETHWMWFVFPQIKGLGQSAMAHKYAILTLGEAKAYLAHPVLGERLRACTRLVTSLKDTTAEAIFGYPDCLKFHSSLTLFAQAAGEDRTFMDALTKYFRSELDAQTIDRL